MNEKETAIIEAAVRVIQRYGVKRTTMNDISDEAGISRQTLYSIFPSKEELLRATIRLHRLKTLAGIDKGCSTARSLEEKLDVLFEYLARKPRKLMDASPDAADIVIGFNEAAREELDAACCDFREVITGILSPYEAQIRASGLTVHQLSDYMQNATDCIKKEAKSPAHLKELLHVLKALVLGVTRNLGGQPAQSS